MNKELKKCPFCDGNPQQSAKKKYVRCSNIDCPCSMTWFEVVEWNTRVVK